MKKNFDNKTKLLVCIIVSLWLIFLFIAILLYARDSKENWYGAIMSTFSALIAGIALIVAYWGIYIQNKDINRQLDIEIFTKTISGIVDSDRFRESRVYIFSNQFTKDIITVRQILGRKNFDLNDLYHLCYQKGEEKYIVDKKLREKLRVSYERILYFCSKMEYLGIIYKEEVAAKIIVSYYGQTIVQSYKRLCPLIYNSNNEDSIYWYPHYKRLYNYALINEMIFKSFATILKNENTTQG